MPIFNHATVAGLEEANLKTTEVRLASDVHNFVSVVHLKPAFFISSLSPQNYVLLKLIHVDQITAKDFMGGNGGHHNRPGNQMFLACCEHEADSYKNAGRASDKTEMAKAILADYTQYGGRYLKKLKGEWWYQVDDETTRGYISQKLRSSPKSEEEQKKREERKKLFAKRSAHMDFQGVEDNASKPEAELDGNG